MDPGIVAEQSLLLLDRFFKSFLNDRTVVTAAIGSEADINIDEEEDERGQRGRRRKNGRSAKHCQVGTG
jgi:hypothetical protein